MQMYYQHTVMQRQKLVSAYLTCTSKQILQSSIALKYLKITLHVSTSLSDQNSRIYYLLESGLRFSLITFYLSVFGQDAPKQCPWIQGNSANDDEIVQFSSI